MANVDINEIISASAIDGINKAAAALEKTYLKIQDNLKVAKQLTTELAKTGNIKEYSKSVKESAMAQEQLRKATASAQLQEERLAAFRANEAKKEEARLKRIEAVRIKANSNGTGPGDYNPYKELNNQYDQAAKRAQNLGAQIEILKQKFGDTPTFQETARLNALAKSFDNASKEAGELQVKLAEIDAKTGKWGRNVGNYRSGWNGLGNSIQQMARELPAFTFSLQTGFLALSNNIPIFYDEIRKARTEISALKAEGKPTESLFKQVAKSVLSFGTLLSIGITLLTVYGKEIGEFISAMFKGSKAIDYFTQRQKEYNEVRRNGFKDAQTELVNMNNLRRAAENVALSFGERKKAVDELQKQYPTTLGNLSDEKILAGEVGDAYSNLTKQILATAFASAASAKIAENRLREFDNEEKRVKARIDYQKEELQIAKLTETIQNRGRTLGGASTGAISGGASAYEIQLQNAVVRQRESAKIIRETNLDSEELNKRNLKLTKDIDKAVQDYGVTVLGVNEEKKKQGKIDVSEFDAQKAMLENISEASKRLFDDERNNLQLRLDALETFTSASQELIENDRKKKIKQAKGNELEIKAINQTSQNEYEALIENSAKKELDIRDKAEKELIKLLKEGIEEQAKLGRQAAANRSVQNALEQEELSKGVDSTLEALANQYANGDITEDEYRQRRLTAIAEFNDDALKLELEGLQAIIDIRKEFGLDTASDEEKLAELRKKYARKATDDQIEQLERLGEAETQLREKRKEAAREVAQFSVEMVNNSFTAQEDRVNEALKQSDDRKNREIENVNESILTEQQKQEQIAVIEAQSEQRKIGLEKRLQEIEVRKAKFQKAAALAEIAISTATAVAKITAQAAVSAAIPVIGAALAAKALAQIPFVIGIGALQAATVLAQPLPKFAQGGTMKESGFAEYGHGVETRINPDGTMSLTSASPEIGWVEKGTTFKSAAETKRLMAKPTGVDVAGNSFDIMPLLASNERLSKTFKKEINKIKVSTTHITEKGFNRTTDKMNRFNNYVKRNFN